MVRQDKTSEEVTPTGCPPRPSADQQVVLLTGALTALSFAATSLLITFGLGLVSLIAPAGVCLLMKAVPGEPGWEFRQILSASIGPWLGYAAAWHVVHGAWHGQGAFIGLAGGFATLFILVLVKRLG
jgi:hypothetical protein